MCLEVCYLADVFRCVKIIFFFILKIFFSSEQMPAVIKMIHNLEVSNRKAVASFVKSIADKVVNLMFYVKQKKQSILC